MGCHININTYNTLPKKISLQENISQNMPAIDFNNVIKSIEMLFSNSLKDLFLCKGAWEVD